MANSEISFRRGDGSFCSRQELKVLVGSTGVEREAFMQCKASST
jgi:hypothetical protein